MITAGASRVASDPLCLHAVATTPAGPMELIRSLLLHQLRPSPDYSWVGSCIISFVACSAFPHVTTCRLAKSPYATLYTGGSGGFVASTAAPIATGWSDPVPGRVYLPLWSSAFHGAPKSPDFVSQSQWIEMSAVVSMTPHPGRALYVALRMDSSAYSSTFANPELRFTRALATFPDSRI